MMKAYLRMDVVRGMENPAAAQAAEIVALTVPYSAHAATVESVREAVLGKVFVDVTVPLVPAKVSRVQMPPAGSASQEAQNLLGRGGPARSRDRHNAGQWAAKRTRSAVE